MSNEVEKIYVLKLFLQNNFKGYIVGGRCWNGLTSLFFFTGKNLLYFLMLNSHSFLTLQKQPLEVFYKKKCSRNFTKFTGQLFLLFLRSTSGGCFCNVILSIIPLSGLICFIMYFQLAAINKCPSRKTSRHGT